MQRAVTAIYRSAAVADLVREDLERLGIARANITVLPGAATMPGATDASLSTAGAQDLAGDAVDRLHDLDLPEDDTRTYQQALRNGDHVVSVQVDDDADLARIQEIMRRPEDAYDLDELDTRYGDAAYVPRRQGSGGVGGEATMGAARANEDGAVEVVEEQLHVGKREVEQGAVRVRSFVREQPVEADVQLRSTRVFVERRPVDAPASLDDLQRQDRVIEAHETGETPVVAKEARVVEEIGLRKETESRTETISDTVRHTEVEIEDERTGERTTLTGGATGSGASGSRT